jgi:Lrp/AsnC family transcriptional regulator for asnA, asnC and gidA
MAHSVDEFDREIIALLQQNGRLSNVEIARTLGITEGTVRKRLERLLNEEIIRIVAVAEPAALGLTATVIIGIQTELGDMSEVAQRLMAIPEVHCVNLVTGTYDIMLEAVLPSADHLLSFLIDKVSTVPGVRRTETTHVLRTVKRACDWAVPQAAAGRTSPLPETSTGADQVVPGAIVVS